MTRRPSPCFVGILFVVLLASLTLEGPIRAQASSEEPSSVCSDSEALQTADLAGPLELCGTTRVEGRESASLAVWLSAEARIATPFGSSPDLDVEGVGRFVGFVLTGVEEATTGITLLGGRFPSHSNPVEFVVPLSPYPAASGNYDFVKNYPSEVTLPSGAYRLYLLTDGHEAALTLRFRGLLGSSELVPTGPANYELRFPEPRALGGAGITKNLYSAGSARNLPRQGLVFHALWLETDVYAAGQYAFCYASGAGPDPNDLGPACPVASSDWSLLNDRSFTTVPDTKLFLEGYDRIEGGRHMLGLWYAAESVVTDLQYAQVWLSYEDSDA